MYTLLQKKLNEGVYNFLKSNSQVYNFIGICRILDMYWAPGKMED